MKFGALTFWPHQPMRGRINSWSTLCVEFNVTYTICKGLELDVWRSQSVMPANCQYDFIC